jgi:CRISPR-associated protein (TIGR02710 family)
LDRILFITVGTGVGENKEEKIKSLAHGILASIFHWAPSKVLFFGTKKSKATVNEIKSQYQSKTSRKLDFSEFIEITNYDKFDHCFLVMKKEMDRLENSDNNNHDIIIDYTSGTKTMTTAASTLSILYHKKLSLISGKRGKKGIVVAGTEQIHDQNLYSVYDILLLEKVQEFFNSFRFEQALDTLDQIISIPERKKKNYNHLLVAYSLWDKFNHSQAVECLNLVDREFLVETSKNKEFLNKLVNTSDPSIKNEFLLADLINNAERRILEAKFDDAIARLYRSVELFAQYILLKNYKLETNNINIGILRDHSIKEEYIEILEDLGHSYDGKIKIGLYKSYDLLNQLNHPIGSRFLDDKEIQNLLTKRNNSILAHGYKQVKKEDVLKLKSKIIDFINVFVNNFEPLKRKAIFPEF